MTHRVSAVSDPESAMMHQASSKSDKEPALREGVSTQLARIRAEIDVKKHAELREKMLRPGLYPVKTLWRNERLSSSYIFMRRTL